MEQSVSEAGCETRCGNPPDGKEKIRPFQQNNNSKRVTQNLH